MADRPEPDSSCVLAVNGGSSSLKFALFRREDPPWPLLRGQVERVGSDQARLKIKGEDGEGRAVDALDQAAAAGLILEEADRRVGLAAVAAVGHRVVHGGPDHFDPEPVTPKLLHDLKKFSAFDPDHLPGEIALIEAFAGRLPGRPQLACFDTAFHRDLPRVAQILPLPRRFGDSGVRRYGFHGLSYEYLMRNLHDSGAGGGRVVLAHLGSGASLAAVKDGKPVDTSMGFTPAAGLVMGTRSGDLDPGLVGYCARTEGMSAERFATMVNKESGLLGVSGTSADLRDLLGKEAADPHAADAVALFCYTVRKWVGAYAAALGGLDTLVFAGGIGEHAPAVRSRVCDGLEFLGVRVDPGRNGGGESLISPPGSAVAVRVIPTDEELTIARALVKNLGN